MTLKLLKDGVVKIVEVTQVDVFPCGKAKGSDAKPHLRTNKVREISAATPDGQRLTFYVGFAEESYAGDADRWAIAYVENAHGATTETVRPE